MKITNKYGPNTTVLLPGSCNADCEFCFWNRDESKIRVPVNYVERVFDLLEKLPDDFQCLSISGGEPTLSPYFGRFLSELGRYRRGGCLSRVVLTTHGGNLAAFIPLVGATVDHINISRHAIGTFENRNVFRTNNIPTDEELRALIERVHCETACDVTLNCVIPDDNGRTDHIVRDFCKNFIAYAKDLGADAVSFRKEASTVAPTRAEKAFIKHYGIVGETKCPVCRGVNQIVNGFDVRWKGTVHEPSIETNGVYEVVIHPDGKAYTDWGMQVPLKLGKTSQTQVAITSPRPLSDKRASPVKAWTGTSSGCGGRKSSSGCGGGFGSSGCGSGGC